MMNEKNNSLDLLIKVDLKEMVQVKNILQIVKEMKAQSDDYFFLMGRIVNIFSK